MAMNLNIHLPKNLDHDDLVKLVWALSKVPGFNVVPPKKGKRTNVKEPYGLEEPPHDPEMEIPTAAMPDDPEPLTATERRKLRQEVRHKMMEVWALPGGKPFVKETLDKYKAATFADVRDEDIEDLTDDIEGWKPLMEPQPLPEPEAPQPEDGNDG